MLFIVKATFFCSFISIPQEDNDIKLYTTFDDNISEVFIEHIYAAKKTITLSIYSLHDALILKALATAKAQGIHVTIHSPDIRSSELQNIASIWFKKKKRPLWHHKILVIDSRIVCLSSANMTQKSLFVDENVTISMCNANLAKHIESKVSDPYRTYFEDETTSFWLGPSDIKHAKKTLIDSISHTKKLQAALYFLTEPALKKSMSEVVDKSIFLQKNQHNSKAKLPMVSTFGILHTKMCLLDDETLYFGSANYSKSGFKTNHEYIMCISPLPQREVRKLHSFFYRLRLLSGSN